MSARFRSLLLAAALCVGAGAAHAQAPAAVASFDLVDLAGTHHMLSAYRGKWVVVNVWASWCAPCIQEMPELDALGKRHDDVVVIGLAADGEDPAKIKRFANALKVSYPIIAGDAAQLRPFHLRAFPTTLVFNPAGEQVARREGRIIHHDIDTLTGHNCP